LATTKPTLLPPPRTVRTMPRDFCRCEIHSCPAKDSCLRYQTPTVDDGPHFWVIAILEPGDTKCREYVNVDANRPTSPPPPSVR
jgi:hypothetical protein